MIPLKVGIFSVQIPEEYRDLSQALTIIGRSQNVSDYVRPVNATQDSFAYGDDSNIMAFVSIVPGPSNLQVYVQQPSVDQDAITYEVDPTGLLFTIHPVTSGGSIVSTPSDLQSFFVSDPLLSSLFEIYVGGSGPVYDSNGFIPLTGGLASTPAPDGTILHNKADGWCFISCGESTYRTTNWRWWATNTYAGINPDN